MPGFNFYQEIHIIKIEKVSQAQLCESTTHQHTSLKPMILSIRITYIFVNRRTSADLFKRQCNAQNNSTRLLCNMSFLVKIESGHKLQSTYI